MSAFAGAGIEKNRAAAIGVGSDIGPAIRAALVVAAIYCDIRGNILNPAEQELWSTGTSRASGGLAIKRAGEKRPRPAGWKRRRGFVQHARMETAMHKKPVPGIYPGGGSRNLGQRAVLHAGRQL